MTAKSLLEYDNLLKYLRKKGYREIREGEFVVREDKELEISDVLVIRRGKNYRNELNKIKKEIADSAAVVEGDRKEYGILFVDNYVIFLRRVTTGLSSKVVILKKSLDRISPAFENKFKKLLGDLGNWQYWDKLFDRSDIIDEFYKLYIKARENLLKHISGITDDKKKQEFADNLLMQLLIIWYLQEKGFLDGDSRYLITKFKEYKRLGFGSYYEFLKGLFRAMMREPNDGVYYEDSTFGRIVVTGPAPFLNGGFGHYTNVKVPDEVFYKDKKDSGESVTEFLKKAEPKNVTASDVPILNLFESRDWTEGNIDEYVLGAIFEKLMTAKDRKEKGAYYTPEPITEYICDNTIKPYLIDRINEQFGTDYQSLDEFFEKDVIEEHYAFLFNELQNIRILDPACGSGHFIETAINVLVDIYESIWRKAKELGFSTNNFTILSSDEYGDLVEESFLEIDDENERILKLKFHIIISRNVYGVDILPSAIKVARARLFLSLAKHFDASKGTSVRFPNVHFNLRVGNSLVGFADFSAFEQVEGQLTLEQFFVTDDGGSLNIVLDEDLGEHLKNMDNLLGTNTYVLFTEIRERFGQKITQNLLIKVLKLRSDLIKILLVSLNTRYAVKLKRLIDEITEAFNEKLNGKYVQYLGEKGIKIDLDKLNEIGYFHWIMEFSEVFLEKGGFDIVVGNPPYLRQEDINNLVVGVDYKSVLSAIYEPYDNTFDFSMFFVLRSLQLTKEHGYHSFIITNKWLRARYGSKIRRFLREKVTIKKVVDFSGVKVFVGATVDTMIYVIRRKNPPKNNRIFYNHPKSLRNIESGGFYVRQSDIGDDVWNFVDERTLEIKKWIEKVGVPLKELDVKIFYGIKTGFNEAFIIDDETRKKLIKDDPKSGWLIKPLLRGRDVKRYYSMWDGKWIIVIPAGFTKSLFKKEGKEDLPPDVAEKVFKEKYPSIYNHFKRIIEEYERKKEETAKKRKGLMDRDDQGDYWWELRPCDYYGEFEKPKIVWTPISGDYEFNYLPFPIYFVHSLFMVTGAKQTLKSLLVIMNSNIRKLLLKLFTNIGAIGTYAYGSKEKMARIPIRLPNNTEPYEILADYLLFLNAKEDWREKYRERIHFLDRNIVDPMIYELYFKDKFHEDGLYPESKYYLLEAVSRHLKPINYDEWAKLYWRKKIYDDLSEEEEQRLKELEEQNLRTIQEVVEALKNDHEVQKWIDVIRSHEWVKVIEGAVNGETENSS